MGPLAVSVVRADPTHIPHLADTMRPGDAAEVLAQGKTPTEALMESLERSTYAWTALADGLPIAMWGVTVEDILAPCAVVWCLTGDGVNRHKVTFLRYSRAFVEYLRATYHDAWNIVDSRYEGAIRWVKWLGFSVCGEVMIGDVPFYLVTLRRDV